MLARVQELPDLLTVTDSAPEHFIQQHGQLKTYKKHSLIYSAGDPATAVFMISNGEVKISRYTTEGRELALEHLSADTIFGETEVLMGKKRECQATARTNLIVYAVERETLLAHLENDPKLSLWLSKQMALRQARMESRLESLLFKSANGKVSQVLLQLAEEHGRKNGEGILIDYPITHQEIGNLIATTRETVSYAFMEFRQQGLITTKQRKTILHDIEGLELIALD